MCGLAGAIGPKINKDKLRILFLYNDARGGDSCGFYDQGGLFTETRELGKAYEHKGKFSNVLSIADIDANGPFVLGHARAASPGVPITKENAHPFVLETIIGAHNGIIRNIKELCEEYGVEPTTSDSKSLFKIIDSFEGDMFKVQELLGKYIGAAALTWVDDKNNLYIFRGESRRYEDSPVKDYWEERPMYVGMVGKTLYYSSIADSLAAIDAHPLLFKDFEIEGNMIYKIAAGKIVEKFPVSRANAYMEKKVFTTAPTKKSSKTTNASGKTSTADTDVMLSEKHVVKSGGAVYMWRGRYYRNGHLLGKNAPVTLILDEAGYSHYGKLVEEDGVSKCILGNGTKVEAEQRVFVKGLLLKKGLTEFDVDTYYANGRFFHMDWLFLNLVENFVRFDDAAWFDGTSAKFTYGQGKWNCSQKYNAGYGEFSVKFPFTSTVYDFKDGMCINARETHVAPPMLALETQPQQATIPFIPDSEVTKSDLDIGSESESQENKSDLQELLAETSNALFMGITSLSDAVDAIDLEPQILEELETTSPGITMYIEKIREVVNEAISYEDLLVI